LVFALNYTQLNVILKEVIPALKAQGKLWIAYPKPTSKIVSDLNRDCNWDCLCTKGFGKIDEVVIDHVWTAIRFCTSRIVSNQAEIDLDTMSLDATVKDVVIKPSRTSYSAIETAIS
jgi:hypothetical protein